MTNDRIFADTLRRQFFNGRYSISLHEAAVASAHMRAIVGVRNGSHEQRTLAEDLIKYRDRCRESLEIVKNAHSFQVFGEPEVGFSCLVTIDPDPGCGPLELERRTRMWAAAGLKFYPHPTFGADHDHWEELLGRSWAFRVNLSAPTNETLTQLGLLRQLAVGAPPSDATDVLAEYDAGTGFGRTETLSRRPFWSSHPSHEEAP